MTRVIEITEITRMTGMIMTRITRTRGLLGRQGVTGTTGMTRMTGMTWLQGLYPVLIKKIQGLFKDFSRTNFPFFKDPNHSLEYMSFFSSSTT